MLSNIKNIIFDIGGVLIDLDREHCVESFKKIGFAEAERLIDLYHPAAMFNDLERGKISLEEVCDMIRERSGATMSNEQISQAYSSFLSSLPVEKLRLIASIRDRGFKTYALSNINPLVMDRVEELFEGDGHPMSYYFDKAYLSYQMKALKPEREIYELLIADSGISPEQTLFIDDSEKNIAMGREMGLQVYLAQGKEDFSHLFSETLTKNL
ncbi:MAG: HAD family phosphatase [Rikenellaceae bacterium]